MPVGWPVGAPWPGHPELQSFEPGAATAYLHLQRIDGPPQVHLDLESDDRDGAVGTAVSLGAELMAERDRWTTLRSPGGLPFWRPRLVEHASPGTGDPARRSPGAHAAGLRRLAPICGHDREVEFWRRLLAGRWVDSGAPEFAGKWHDDAGSPLQPLFQRLDEADGPVRRTWTTGPTTSTERYAGSSTSARPNNVGPGRGGWHVLRDPAGLLFCVTANSPDVTRTRDIG